MQNDLDPIAVREALEQRSNEELIELLLFSQYNYSPDVIALMKDVLMSRGVKPSQIANADKFYNSLGIPSPPYTARPKKKVWPVVGLILLWIGVVLLALFKLIS